MDTVRTSVKLGVSTKLVEPEANVIAIGLTRHDCGYESDCDYLAGNNDTR